MAQRIEGFSTRARLVGRGPSVWRQYADGSCWRLTAGEDFHGTARQAYFSGHKWAGRNGFRFTGHEIDGDLEVQFTRHDGGS